MKLIDKDALVAKIESLRKHYIERDDYDNGWNFALNKILTLIDTLKVKEVDLEKHLKEDIEDVFFDLDGVAVKGATHYLTVEDIKELAKHFFELGMQVSNKAQKGE